MIPAVGQGVIAIEVRSGDSSTRDLVAVHDDAASAAAVKAERALMHRLEGGCQVPIGAHATVLGEKLTMRAYLGSLDGKEFIRDSIEGPALSAEELGTELAQRMFDAGGETILRAVRESHEGEGTGYWT
jgi:hydroxymethylbilane synthase